MRYLATLALLIACKERGTAAIDVHVTPDVAPCVDSAATVIVYAVPNVTCASCACGGCFMGKIVACGNQPCSLDEFHDGALDLDLPAGKAALFYDFFTGDRHLVASACVDIALDRDGTSSQTYETSAQCCAAQ